KRQSRNAERRQPCTLTTNRAAHTSPHRLSAEFGDKMNQFADLENRKSKVENRKSSITKSPNGPMTRSMDWPCNRSDELCVQGYEVLQTRQQVAMRRIRTIKQGMDVQQQSRLGKSARRVFAEGEIAKFPGHDFAGMVIGDEGPHRGKKSETGLGQRGVPPVAGSGRNFAIEAPVPPLGAAAFLAENLAQDSYTQAPA